MMRAQNTLMLVFALLNKSNKKIPFSHLKKTFFDKKNVVFNNILSDMYLIFIPNVSLVKIIEKNTLHLDG